MISKSKISMSYWTPTAIGFLLIAGWISNIIQLITWDNGVTTTFILKCISVFLAPLGSLMGIIGWF